MVDDQCFLYEDLPGIELSNVSQIETRMNVVLVEQHLPQVVPAPLRHGILALCARVVDRSKTPEC